jgi:hypothetical protein
MRAHLLGTVVHCLGDNFAHRWEGEIIRTLLE